jgi:hypothetical protein
MNDENPQTGWPAPTGVSLGNLVSTLGPVLTGLGLKPDLLSTIVSRLVPPAPPAGVHLPDPGTAK